MNIENPELELANQFVQYTNRNIYLTGKAGTGKTTFLHKLKAQSPKRMVVVAPTGVAAINAGGVTIHSFFQLPFGPIIPERLSGEKNGVQKYNKSKINIIKSLDLLVIDEISMVRADMLDGIDEVLRRFKNKHLPFGGVQILLIGDLQQLAPIVKNDEWEILHKYYNTMFFFSSKALQESQPISIELKHIYRQENEDFISILNQIRDNKITEGSLNMLNSRYKPNFNPPKEEGYINLTTHNANANRVNQNEINKLSNKSHTYTATITGNFPEYTYPTDERLTLKKGAQVMFVKNDSKPEKEYFNGKIGQIVSINDETITVKCPEDRSTIEVSKEKWDNITYNINESTKEIEEEIIGTFTQYPLRLAWAITIHKSQGLTFEKAIIDAEAAFAHGQTYVALSRCKSLEGIVLSSKISSQAIICNQSVSAFNKQIENNQPSTKELHLSQQKYQLSLIKNLFDYETTQYNLIACKKDLQAHDYRIQGNLLETINTITEGIIPQLIKITNSFLSQVVQLQDTNTPIEQNEALQDRIKKACIYFHEKSAEEIIKPLNNSTFSTDNKTINKNIREHLKKIDEDLGVKKICQESCKEGFSVQEYLKTRAKAILKKSDSSLPTKDTSIKTVAKHPELFQELFTWRKNIAEKVNKSTSQIVTIKAMIEISNELPCTSYELNKINGIGPKRISDFGVDILNIVNKYCSKHQLRKGELLL